MGERIFETMEPAAKKFYSSVFNTAFLNAYAVHRGYFNMYLCETTDPMVSLRWKKLEPQIKMLFFLERGLF